MSVLQLLVTANNKLQQSRSFQGGFREIYKEESPLAGILATVHGVRIILICMYICSYIVLVANLIVGKLRLFRYIHRHYTTYVIFYKMQAIYYMQFYLI